MKKSVCALSLLLGFVFLAGLNARDINLDAIYINQDSRLYERLLESKIDAYREAGSRFIDRDVIFACWGDGFSIIYVKELPLLNIIRSFNRSDGRGAELFRITGTITAFRCTANGRFLVLKRLVAVEGAIPRGETLVLDVRSKTIKKLQSSYPFIDFSLASGGNSLFYETGKGIVEYLPDTGVARVAIQRSEYAGIATAGAPAIAYMSPNRKKAVIVSGSGGSYRSRMIVPGNAWPLPGVTSASEICWVDNNRLAYRTGESGNYSVRLYDTVSRRSVTLVRNSLNTNLQFSVFPKMISFLQDQIICFHDLRDNESVNTGLEGEDVTFSPDGNRIVSLYLKKLFLTSVATIKKKNIEMAKAGQRISSLYRQVLGSPENLTNEYSSEYVRKKLSAYGRIGK
ncbi:MAG: hypothetical protein JXA07_03400 [Spirochaetes bacterium]|nr:hypothetical protein [Spirochaetota bacterium]